MPHDLADDLKSMSFGSSDRSGSETTASTGSGDRPVIISDDNSEDPGGSQQQVSLSDLSFVERLGSGDIGSVYLAELKCAARSPPLGIGSGFLLAAKVMDNKELEARNKQARASTERQILQMLDHPFLPRLYAVADNHRWSCLLTEFCPGGDLHVLRQRQPAKRFDDSAVRFYASEVVVALEYLHMLGVVYRDLKPENVLVRSDGHIMLTDFDLSLKSDGDSSPAVQLVSNKNLPSSQASVNISPFTTSSCILPNCIVPAVSCFHPKSKRRRKPGRRNVSGLEFVAEPVDLRSMSFVGTHEYLAPEIVSGEGHGSTVDWWTLGVFIYELLYGATPFKGSDNDLTLANIVARALEFPKDPPVSSSAKDLISGLLAKDPANRMGSATGATAIKRHPFFSSVNWALLRCTSPPYIPPPFSRCSSSREGSEDDSCPGTPVDYY